MIGLIITTDGQMKDFNYDDYDYTKIQEIVGGFIEPISFGEKWYFCYANEEAKLVGLPENKLVTELWYNSGEVVMLGDYIAGDVVFFGESPVGGFCEDYPFALIEDLRISVSNISK